MSDCDVSLFIRELERRDEILKKLLGKLEIPKEES